MVPPPELSIIIPVLNERAALAPCWENLRAQQGIDFEVLFVDGGSSDGTSEWLQSLALTDPDRARFCRGTRGRGRQLNLGVRAATGPWLLFLHVDSRLTHPDQLAKALATLRQACIEADHTRLAGHFPLRFSEPKTESALGYFYCETKARLDRPGCTHGDQGFLLSREFFQEVGPFEEHWPVLEDTRLAERIRQEGRWLLLPGDLLTSPRRFEVEGLRQRQTLNALIMNFAALEWMPFFEQLPGLYRSQDRTRRLLLTPFFNGLQELLDRSPRRQRWSLWYRTGSYVRSQGWQLALALDVRRQFRQGLPVGEGEFFWLRQWDKAFNPLTDHPPARALTALLVWCWYRLSRRRWGRNEALLLASSSQPASKEPS